MSKGKVFDLLLDFTTFYCVYILINLKLNVKNININVDIEANDWL